MTGDVASDAPYFARLCADPGSPLSPRMAARLWATAVMLADTYGEGRWHLLTRSLPPVVRRLADDVWMERFVSCFDVLACRFEARQVDATQIATCTAEEMALHLVIDEAEGTAGDASLGTDLSLPVDPARADDFDAVRELLFRDHDVLMLFDGSLDGIEAPDSALGEHRLFANLHPRAWFLPFADGGEPSREHELRF